ncbi:YwbE family protein [Ancylomarina sp. YFZ004]
MSKLLKTKNTFEVNNRSFILSKQIEIAFDLKISIQNTMENSQPDGKKRKDITVGLEVEIVLKQDQRSGDLTDGVVKRILTKSPNHPHGIKVQLETGEVGRVKNILDED